MGFFIYCKLQKLTWKETDLSLCVCIPPWRSVPVDSGLRTQGVNQRWGTDIYRLAPINVVYKTRVNLPEDPEQSVKSTRLCFHSSLLRHTYVTFLTWDVSCHIRISCVRTCLLPLAGTIRVHTLIYVDWLANVLVVFGLRSTILYASPSCKVIEWNRPWVVLYLVWSQSCWLWVGACGCLPGIGHITQRCNIKPDTEQ